MEQAAAERLIEGYRLVSRCFSYPDEDLTDELTAGTFGGACTLSDDAPLKAAYQGKDPADILARLRPLYTKLFIGVPKPKCTPYESTQRGRLADTTVSLFVNPIATAVRQAYRTRGIVHSQGNSEPADHIAAEAEFAAYLVFNEANGAFAADDAAPQADGEKTASPERAATYESFHAHHLSLWFYLLANNLREETDEPLYLYAAALLDALAPKSKLAEEEERHARLQCEESGLRTAQSDALEARLTQNFFGPSSQGEAHGGPSASRNAR